MAPLLWPPSAGGHIWYGSECEGQDDLPPGQVALIPEQLGATLEGWCPHTGASGPPEHVGAQEDS